MNENEMNNKEFEEDTSMVETAEKIVDNVLENPVVTEEPEKESNFDGASFALGTAAGAVGAILVKVAYEKLVKPAVKSLVKMVVNRIGKKKPDDADFEAEPEEEEENEE